MKRYCLALDLKDDTALIAEYEKYHLDIWPEIKKASPIQALLIWKYIAPATGYL